MPTRCAIRATICALATLFASVHICATTIRVPAEHATIQQAIDAAATGDTVLVASGAYTGYGNFAIDYGGTDLVLLSEAGADSTIIDCEHKGPGVVFLNGETAAAVLEGFTIRGGMGGVVCGGSSPTLKGSHITAGATETGAGLFCSGDAFPLIQDCSIDANTAETYGGGVRCTWGASPRFERCTISDNFAGLGGGVYFDNDASTAFADCRFSGNDITGRGGSALDFHGAEGVSLRRCILELNGNESSHDATLKARRSSFMMEDCEVAANFGPGLDIAGGSLMAHGCEIRANDAAGIISNRYDWWTTPSLTLESCEVSDNRGRGIDASNTDLGLTDCEITGNVSGWGAGISLSDSPNSVTLTHCLIADNISTSAYGGASFTGAMVTMINCEIAGNSAGGSGGGLGFGSSTATLENCRITDNRAEGPGGGIRIDFADLHAHNCVLSGNTTTEGGGLYMSDAFAALDNCMITNNVADSTGGGIGLSGSSFATLHSCTFTGNSAGFRGGALLLAHGYANATLVNSILWGNSPDEANTGGVHGILSIQYSDVRGGYEGTANIDADPLFFDPVAGDYHLSWGSPCIDAGSSSGAPDVDFEMDTRPAGEGYDMGADEHLAVAVSSSTPRSHAPLLGRPHPNPFNPRTELRFHLERTGPVRLVIHDLRGAIVRVLVDRIERGGDHALVWDGRNSAGAAVASGLYIARITTERSTAERSLVLLK